MHPMGSEFRILNTITTTLLPPLLNIKIVNGQFYMRFSGSFESLET